MLDTDSNQPRAVHRLAATAVAILAILGAIALATAALLTTDIDVDDLFDSLRPVRIPALQFVVVSFLASLFLTGRSWARWGLALILAGGSVWVLLFMEISGPWLWGAVAVAIVWGLCAIALVVSARIARYTESMADHWKTSYERLIGPLVDEDDARRWLSMFDTWDNAGVLTRGDRKRIARALASWLERTGPHADDVAAGIESVSATTGSYAVTPLVRRVVGRRRPSE